MAKYPKLMASTGDKHQALYQGLLNMGANMGGYSDKPVSLLSQLSQGGKDFGAGYQGSIREAKQGKMDDMTFQKHQQQMEAQAMQLEQAKIEQARAAEQKRLQDRWASFEGETSGPGGMGSTKDDALKAAFPQEYAKQKIGSMFPTPTNSRASSPIQNFAQRQELVLQFGEGSPEVRRFDDYVRATQYKDTGAGISRMSPSGAPEPVVQKTLKPGEEPEVKRAQAEQAAIGGAIGTELGQASAMLDVMTANMPELEAAVVSMGDLGDKATYNWAQRATDEANKQLGADPTEGALARAEYVSRARQEILPLLRLTFGAAFTEKEGDKLMETLADADAHPKVKRRILAAFIEKKRNQIKSLQRQTGKESGADRKKKYGLE